MLRFACMLWLAACATTSAQGPVAASGSGSGSGAGSGSGSGSGSNMICREVSDTGSMFSHTECTPADEDEQQRSDAQRTLQRMPQGTPKQSH